VFLACSGHNIGSGSSHGRRARAFCLPPALQHVAPPDLRAFVASQPSIPRAALTVRVAFLSYQPPRTQAAQRPRWTRSAESHGTRFRSRTHARAFARSRSRSVRPPRRVTGLEAPAGGRPDRRSERMLAHVPHRWNRSIA
jgi:hypothetical protein